MFAGAGSVDINSAVGGEVRTGAGSISIGPDAKIAKDLYYSMGDSEAGNQYLGFRNQSEEPSPRLKIKLPPQE